MNRFFPQKKLARSSSAIRIVMMMFVIGLLLVPSLAYAASPAESFVAQNIQKGLQILSDKSISFSQRSDRFRDFLTSLTDARRIGMFTLGPAARSAPKADVDAFVSAFHDFAVAVYQSQLSRYSGQTLKVTGSMERRPGDYIVNTVMIDPNAQGQQPLEVAFRIGDEGGHFVVLDVSVAGIWLAIEERDQFTAFLSEHHNNVAALVAHIRQLTQQMRSSGVPPTTH